MGVALPVIQNYSSRDMVCRWLTFIAVITILILAVAAAVGSTAPSGSSNSSMLAAPNTPSPNLT
jgi:hypothetical protein